MVPNTRKLQRVKLFRARLFFLKKKQHLLSGAGALARAHNWKVKTHSATKSRGLRFIEKNTKGRQKATLASLIMNSGFVWSINRATRFHRRREAHQFIRFGILLFIDIRPPFKVKYNYCSRLEKEKERLYLISRLILTLISILIPGQF